jgi:Asp-tRNA(Asn)/Glu-tRNA(Gln) amidotransferase B subunit
MNELSSEQAMKYEIKRLLDFLESNGIVEETKQTYKRIKLETIFEKDKKELYTILENLKTLIE